VTGWLAPAATITIFFLPLLPLVFGTRLLCFRDAFITHFPISQWASARERGGIVPFLDFAASNVEPLLANPNTVSLYPTHLLYRVLPAAAAFNLHLLLHVAWAFFGAALLARRLGASRPASWIGGAAYAFSGPYVSYAAAFTNAAAAAAWAPWAVAEAVRLARRGPRLRAFLALSIALALQLLAGEPAVSAWTVAACAIPLVAALARSAKPGVRSAAAGAGAGVAALVLAAPLLLATRAAVPWSFRGVHLFSRDQFAAAGNVPLRWLESLVPLVFGSPRPLVSGAFWGYRLFDSLQPYLYSLNFGLAPLLLLATAFAIPEFRRRKIVRVAAVSAGVFLLLSYGFRTPLFELLWAVPPLRHFRYPIKFAVAAALAISSLAALAADAWSGIERSRALVRAAIAAGAALAAAAGLVLAAPAALRRLVAPAFRGMAFGPDQVLPGIFRTVLVDTACGAAAMTLLVLAFRRRPGAGRAPFFLAATLATLVPSAWPLFVSVPAAAYVARPPLASAVGGTGRVWVGDLPEFTIVKYGTRHSFPVDDVGALILAGRSELWPLTGIPDGIRYAWDKDPDGSYGFLDRVFFEAIASKPPAERARLLSAASVRWTIGSSAAPLAGYRAATSAEISERRVYVSEAIDPVPLVRAPARVFRRSSLSGAVDLIASDRFDPRTDVVLRGPDEDPAGPRSDGRVGSAREQGNGFAADFDSSAGTVAVFAATYFRYWRATIDGAAVPVEIADGNFCGVRVPPGRHRVALFYDEGPFRVGAIASLIAAALVLGASFGMGRKSPRPGGSG